MTDHQTGGRDGQRYVLESLIATGGMGEVWRARDTVLSREVALKLLKNEYAGDPTFRTRFETEARNAAALHHPNVASVFDFGELPAGSEPGSAGRRSFLVMELVRGEPLSALLRSGEPMLAGTAADLVAQAADGLAAAHALGIVHRDVKPANLLVTPDRTVKITDFGIARAADAVALTQTGQVIGTPQYLSPEQAEGRSATEASDIYSLGVVLYQCLAGRRPFDGESPVAIALAHLRETPPPLSRDVPAGLRAVVETALAKDPRDRFATMRDLAVALRTEPGTAPMPVSRPAPAPLPAHEPASGPAPGMGSTREVPAIADLPRAPVAPPRQRDGRRSGAWLPWLLLAAVVVAAVVLVLRVTGGSGGTGTDPSPSPTPSAGRSASQSPSGPAQVTIDEGDYLGEPRRTATRELGALGLKVTLAKEDNPGDETPGTVTGVDPSGTLDKGSRVTLTYYDEPEPPESPTPTPSDTPTASPTQTPAPEPTGTPTAATTGTPTASAESPSRAAPDKTKKTKKPKGRDR